MIYVDSIAIYAAFGAALLGRSTWKINFEGNYTVMGIAADKKLFHRHYESIRGLEMIIPAFPCAIQFTRQKSIQSYVLLMKHGSWHSLCRAGPSKIYERLNCKPDLIGEFISEHIICRKTRSAPGKLDPSQFNTVRGGAFTERDNRYGIQVSRGDPSKYKDVAAMTLLHFKELYEEWCSSSDDRVPFKDYFNQPSIAPIRNELASHSIVTINPNFDFTTNGDWKRKIKDSKYCHMKYVLLGCYCDFDSHMKNR